MKFARKFNGAFKVRAGIAGLKSGMLPIVQARRKHFISIGRIFIAKIADVIGHAEDFLNEDEPAPPRAFRLGVVRGRGSALVEFVAGRRGVDDRVSGVVTQVAEALPGLSSTGRILDHLVDDLRGSRERQVAARTALVRFGRAAGLQQAPAQRPGLGQQAADQRQVAVLRAYVRYLHQAGTSYSRLYKGISSQP